MDNVVRSNDRVAFACVFKKAALHPPDVGSYVDGVPISSDRDDQLRKQAELLDKKRCDVSCARFVEDAKAMGVASVVPACVSYFQPLANPPSAGTSSSRLAADLLSF